MMQTPLRRKQQGFSLFLVLIIMLVLAFLVIAAVQTFNTESRLSSNDADYKEAMSAAETALRTGEEKIADLGSSDTFTLDCTKGLCIPAGGVGVTPAWQKGSELFTVDDSLRQGSCFANCATPAWKRTVNADRKDINILDGGSNSQTVSLRGGNFAKPPRYIIEYLGMTAESNTYSFRVSARAWGKNANTVVTVQSYVEAALSD